MYQSTYQVKPGDTKLNRFRVTYQFNNSKFGFQNSITVNAFNEDHAIDNAKKEVSDCYGSKMLRRFSFLKADVVQ